MMENGGNKINAMKSSNSMNSMHNIKPINFDERDDSCKEQSMLKTVM
jgi:hypothetical protein